MSSHFNLIGSIFLAGIVFLMINRFHSSMVDNSHEKTLDSMTSYNCSEISKLLEFDFYKMGFGVDPGTSPLTHVDSTRISFMSDIDENGAIDIVSYILSDENAAFMTENPRDRILYRVINNNTPEDAPYGVTEFRIRYFDALGNLTNNISQIRTFEITLTIESTMPYNDRYSHYHWQTRISPPNLM